MTHEQALAHNRAIELAVANYSKGIGAIKSLRINTVVTVDHVGTTTKQEVVDVES